MGFDPLIVGVASGDDPCAGDESRGIAVELRASQRDTELSVTVRVDPADRCCIFAAIKRFEPVDCVDCVVAGRSSAYWRNSRRTRCVVDSV